MLQRETKRTWTTLNIGIHAKKGSAHAHSTLPSGKGTQHHRVSSGSAHSRIVTITFQLGQEKRFLGSRPP
ncbi:hypothetical protein AQI88_03525 [Streptomyces cellostaticus]|uniref:Uncharacterized protein n=1 Tax=Streptomyces cellostaticus TaxID=67285 RepID=A0A117PYG2_9ACTN|nr:hypothetical protein AQI88_03525 [Streptomyces cellostaticus]